MGAFAVLLLMLMMGRRRTPPLAAPAPATERGPGAFPTDSTAVQTLPASVIIPASAPAETPASAPAVAKPRGVLPGSPEPGFRPYVPVPSPVVARAQQVLASGQLRVTEADPTGRFALVRYRREADPKSGRIAVTAWRTDAPGANA